MIDLEGYYCSYKRNVEIKLAISKEQKTTNVLTLFETFVALL